MESMLKTVPTTAEKQLSVDWFRTLRDQICSEFEAIEDEGHRSSGAVAGRFEKKTWVRQSEADSEAGGGEMSLMRGQIFEKVGVNISTVYGLFSDEFRKQVPGAEASDGKFWASGISVVAHMKSPRVPAVHMNTRHIMTSHGWFGGGADLTPMDLASLGSAEDTAFFHAGLKQTCDQFGSDYFEKYHKWCDEYFFLKHRNETRGTGGIFYDGLDSGHWAQDFAFTQAVGRRFLDLYPQIVRRRMFEPWTTHEREQQLVRRGRYAEFNLLYDRGTVFGLKTGGNVEAILMSLPPEAKWP